MQLTNCRKHSGSSADGKLRKLRETRRHTQIKRERASERERETATKKDTVDSGTDSHADRPVPHVQHAVLI